MTGKPAQIGPAWYWTATALVVAACLSAQAEPPLELQLGGPTGKRLSALHFAVVTPFSQSGFAVGVQERPRDLRRALEESGVRALRFPGGNDVYFYLPEGREQTVRLAHAEGDWSIRDDFEPASHWVSLEQLATFARDAGLQLIYQLPALTYLDGDTPRAIIPNEPCKATPSLFDRPRVEEGVAYGMRIVRRLRELRAPVAAWEIGNEEFALCSPADYAQVAAAYAREIRRLEPKTPILVEGMGANAETLIPALRAVGAMDEGISFRVHYPFGNWPGPPGKDRSADAGAFVLGDVRFERWLLGFAEGCSKLGVPWRRASVTETMVFRFQEGYWDPYALIATHAHALLYAWNWMTLLERPEVDMATFHDLDSPYFGLLRYNVGFEAKTRHFSWLTGGGDRGLTPRFERQYVVSPTGLANRLLAELAGEELVATNLKPTVQLRALASARRVVIVNRSAQAVAVSVPFARAGASALTADALESCLPGSFRVAPLGTRQEAGRTEVAVPAWSVVVVRKQ